MSCIDAALNPIAKTLNMPAGQLVDHKWCCLPQEMTTKGVKEKLTATVASQITGVPSLTVEQTVALRVPICVL